MDSPCQELYVRGLGFVVCSPFGFFGKWCFVCVYWGSNPAVWRLLLVSSSRVPPKKRALCLSGRKPTHPWPFLSHTPSVFAGDDTCDLSLPVHHPTHPWSFWAPPNALLVFLGAVYYIRIFVLTALVDYVHSVTTFVFSCTDPAAVQSRFLPCGRFVLN